LARCFHPIAFTFDTARPPVFIFMGAHGTRRRYRPSFRGAALCIGFVTAGRWRRGGLYVRGRRGSSFRSTLQVNVISLDSPGDRPSRLLALASSAPPRARESEVADGYPET
jgi:hypothetical protein